MPPRRAAPGRPLRLIPDPVPAGQANRRRDAALRGQGRGRGGRRRRGRDAAGRRGHAGEEISVFFAFFPGGEERGFLSPFIFFGLG